MISIINFFPLVFRVGCSHKRQAAQRDWDLIPTGESHDDGRKRSRATPSFGHPDIWWENRMGASQKCTSKRSPLQMFPEIYIRNFKRLQTISRWVNQYISRLLPSSIQIKPTGTLWPWLRAVCVWCAWMSTVAWCPGILTGPCSCCMVAAVRRMGQTAGMTNRYR